MICWIISFKIVTQGGKLPGLENLIKSDATVGNQMQVVTVLQGPQIKGLSYKLIFLFLSIYLCFGCPKEDCQTRRFFSAPKHKVRII